MWIILPNLKEPCKCLTKNLGESMKVMNVIFYVNSIYFMIVSILMVSSPAKLFLGF